MLAQQFKLNGWYVLMRRDEEDSVLLAQGISIYAGASIDMLSCQKAFAISFEEAERLKKGKPKKRIYIHEDFGEFHFQIDSENRVALTSVELGANPIFTQKRAK